MPASFPTSREDTRDIREADWTVGAIPPDLLDRRVEITGPTNAKMLINALNSGAQAFMADFEDATSPVWDELVQGQVNLRDYWRGRLDYTDPGQRQALCGRRQSRGADGPPARLAPARRPCDRRRRGRSPAPCSISRSIVWHNARRRAGARAPGPISICPSSRAGTKRRCGATSSPSPRTSSGSSAGRSRRRC